jgi:nitrogen fixation protein FixH
VILERDGRGYAASFELGPGVWELNISAPETAEGPFALHERLSIGGETHP